MQKKIFTEETLKFMDGLTEKIVQSGNTYCFTMSENKAGETLYIVSWYPL